jgi:hypothetical protein
MIGALENLLKRRKVQEVVVRVSEYEVEDDYTDADNEQQKEILRADLEEFDARLAALEQELQLLRRD